MPRRSLVQPDGPVLSDPRELTAAADELALTSVDLYSPAAADAVLDLVHLAHEALLTAAARRGRG